MSSPCIVKNKDCQSELYRKIPETANFFRRRRKVLFCGNFRPPQRNAAAAESGERICNAAANVYNSGAMAKKRLLKESQVETLLGNFIRKLHGREAATTFSELQERILHLLAFIFENGAERTGTNSKNYTGKSLEIFCKYCVLQVLQFVRPRDPETDGHQVAVNTDYIKDEEKKFDDLRLDLNVFVDDKLILMQESRAWIDKPFCTLKYQVIEDVIYLPHSRAAIADDIIFPVVAFCCDVTERTLTTREFFLNMVLRNSALAEKTSYGAERVRIFQLSLGKRADGYFAKGIDEKSAAAYLEYLHEHFKNCLGRK